MRERGRYQESTLYLVYPLAALPRSSTVLYVSHRKTAVMAPNFFMRVITASLAVALVAANVIPRQVNVESCPGYNASNVKQSRNGLTADLTLAGTACNVHGSDIQDLTLTVEYQSSKHIPSVAHFQINTLTPP